MFFWIKHATVLRFWHILFGDHEPPVYITTQDELAIFNLKLSTQGNQVRNDIKRSPSWEWEDSSEPIQIQLLAETQWAEEEQKVPDDPFIIPQEQISANREQRLYFLNVYGTLIVWKHWWICSYAFDHQIVSWTAQQVHPYGQGCQQWICQSCIRNVALSLRRVYGHCRTALLKQIYHGISREEAQARMKADASANAVAIGVWGQPSIPQQIERAITPSSAALRHI